MNDMGLEISPIPYVYRWGKDNVIEFWVKYSPKKPDITAGFLNIIKEKFVGYTKSDMPIIISEGIDKQVRHLIIPDRWMYFTVIK